MSAEAKILKAAEWASDSSHEHVTGGWNHDRFYRSTAFGRTWLREVLHPLISDAKLDAALDSLVASGQLEQRGASYRLPAGADTIPTRTVRLDYNVGKTLPLTLSATVAALGTSSPHHFEGGLLVAGGIRYFQRTSGEKLSGYHGDTITTDYLPRTRQHARQHADQFADSILLRGDHIWFKTLRHHAPQDKEPS